MRTILNVQKAVVALKTHWETLEMIAHRRIKTLGGPKDNE
jgi:hypothetical protein